MAKENYLLLFLSLGENLEARPSYFYRAPGCTWAVQGRQTNEAPTKHVLKLLASRGEKLSKIIMLCTDEVVPKALPFYRREISRFIEDERLDGYDPLTLFEEIPFDQGEAKEADEVVEPIRKIFEKTSSEKRGRLYVDFTGGMRNAGLMLIFATRILSQSGLDVAAIFYGDMSKGREGVDGSCDKPYIIADCMFTYSTLLELELKANEASREGRKEILAALLDAKGVAASDKRAIEGFYEASEAMDSSVSTNDSSIIEEASEAEKKAAQAITDDMVGRLGSVASGVVMGRAEKGKESRRQLSEGKTKGKVRKNISSGNIIPVLTSLNDEIIPLLRENGLVSVNEQERIYQRKSYGKSEFDHKLVRSELVAWIQYHWTYEDEVKDVLRKLQADRDLSPMSQSSACSSLGKLKADVASQKWFRPVPQDRFLIGYFEGNNPGKAILSEMNIELGHRAIELGSKDIALFAEEANAYSLKRIRAFNQFFSNRFPYVCLGKDGSRNLVFRGYFEDYSRQLLSQLDRLGKLKKADQGDYEREVDNLLTSPEAFEKAFPIVSSNRINANLSPKDSAEFFRRMFPLYDEVRKLRNNSSHARNMGSKEYKRAQEVAGELMALMDEYKGKVEP